MRTIIYFLLAFCFAGMLACKQNPRIIKPDANAPYKDTTLSMEKRLADLVSRMTLEEKARQLQVGTIEDGKKYKDYGICGGFRDLPPYEAAVEYNKLQKIFVEESRLGIPFFMPGECEYGFLGYKTTSFPQSIALAGSWDPEMVGEVAKVIAKETKARGCRLVFAPVVNILRDPRWGRSHECYGEDPYLTSCIAVPYVQQIQKAGIVSCPKHYVANIGINGKFSSPVFFTERRLREIYFPGFKACLQEGGAKCIMSAYNTLDGIPCSTSEWLLNTVLRDEWGFDGFVVSDGAALPMVYDSHLTHETKEDLTATAIKAGCDIDLSTYDYYHQNLQKAVKEGLVEVKYIDRAVRRVLRQKISSGLFDQPYVDPDYCLEVTDSDKHREFARQVAEKCMILLKNENKTLPFSKEVNSVAVLGPLADQLFGTFYAGYGRKEVSVLEGIEKLLPDARVYHARGAEMAWYALPPIQPWYLYTYFNGAKRTGLTAEYFDNENFKGDPVMTRVDRMIEFDWETGSPAKGIPDDHFSVRWSGYLRSPESGLFTIGASIDDGVRIYLDDSLIVDQWTWGSKRLESVKVRLRKGQSYKIRMEYYEGTYTASAQLGWDVRPFAQLPEAMRQARRADVVVIVAGSYSAEGHDRAFLHLSPSQEKLIKEVAKLNKPMAVVLHTGNVITINNWINEVPAIIESWYPGEEGGTAVAKTLFGDVNPGGKLPVSMPKVMGQVPLKYYHLPMQEKTEGTTIASYLGIGDKPQFPFGHGLSYTSFKYKNLRLSKKEINPDQTVDIAVDVTNTGERSGDEIVQLYIHDEVASVAQPVKELKAFKRITLDPGDTKTVSLSLTPEKLKIWSINDQWEVEPGSFKILVGRSSEDIRLTDRLLVE